MLKESGLARKGGFPVHTAKLTEIQQVAKKRPNQELISGFGLFFFIAKVNV